MEKHIIFTAFFFSVLIGVNSLHCYVCYDCKNVSKINVTRCEATTTEIPTNFPLTEPISLGITDSIITSISSLSKPANPTTTSVTEEQASTAPSTIDPSNSATTLLTTEATTSSIISNSTEPSSTSTMRTTTEPSITTTSGATDSSNNSTVAGPIIPVGVISSNSTSTSAKSTITITTSIATESSSPSTTTTFSILNTSGSTIPSTNSMSKPDKDSDFVLEDEVNFTERSRRSIPDGCMCNNEECDCQIHPRSKRNVLHIPEYGHSENIQYACVVDYVKENGTKKVRRGCAVVEKDPQALCEKAGFSKNCKICNKDGCNSASINQNSRTTTAALLILFYILSIF